MRRLIACIAAAMLLSVGAKAQLQVEAGFGVTAENKMLSSCGVGYEFLDMMTIGVKFQGESLFRPYGYYSPWGMGRSVGLFARVYSPGEKLRFGVEADALVSTRAKYIYDAYGCTGRSFTLTPGIYYRFTPIFGLRLDAFRFGFLSETVNADPANPDDYVIVENRGFAADMRTFVLTLVFNFDFRSTTHE